MLQAAPQFTPLQLLDAGRRAEAQGHIEAALQFYRQTVDQYAYCPEAAEAREALLRLNAGRHPKIWHPNGAAPAAEGVQRWHAGARKARRSRPTPGRNPYWIGKALARLISLCGWLIAAGAFFAAPVLLLLGRLEMLAGWPELNLGSLGVVAATLALAMLGLVAVALGQATRALFDQANATRELVAIERAKSGLAD